MTATIVSISNRSLISLGARANIANINEGSVEANACSTLFQPTFESLARTAHWGCLRKQAVLTLLSAAPGTPENVDGSTTPYPSQPWLYCYEYPSDCLQLRYIVPTIPNYSAGSSPLTTASTSNSVAISYNTKIPYAVAYDVDAQGNPITTILTNLPQAQLVYTVNQSNPSVWDSLFQSAMVASLAAYLVPALTLNIALLDRCVKSAEQNITQARVADGNESYNTVNRNASWMTARIVGGGLYGEGGYGSGGAFNNFSSMSWPSYG